MISYNVNGVLNPVKRTKILSKLKIEKAQVALLQETHMSQSEHEKFRHVFFSSYKLGHRRGVAILISSRLNYEHLSETKDKEGRFVSITGRIEGTEITLLNVYAPPGSEWLFYRRIFDLMVNSQGVVICGGDFNIRLNPALDSSGAAIQNRPLIKKVTYGRAGHYRCVEGTIPLQQRIYTLLFSTFSLLKDRLLLHVL